MRMADGLGSFRLILIVSDASDLGGCLRRSAAAAAGSGILILTPANSVSRAVLRLARKMDIQAAARRHGAIPAELERFCGLAEQSGASCLLAASPLKLRAELGEWFDLIICDAREPRQTGRIASGCSLYTLVPPAAAGLEAFLENIAASAGYGESIEHILLCGRAGAEARTLLLRHFLRSANVTLGLGMAAGSPADGWNLALRLADGQFVSRAAIGEMRSPMLLENGMRHLLLSPEDSAVCFGAVKISEVRSGAMPAHIDVPGAGIAFPDFINGMPMWRRSLHHEYGYFAWSMDACHSLLAFWLLASKGREKCGRIEGAWGCIEEGAWLGCGCNQILFKRNLKEFYPFEKLPLDPAPRPEPFLKAPEPRRQRRAGRKSRGRPFVSVITVCRNVENSIEATLESVLSQDCQDFELIIVDGASSDNTLSIINRYLDGVDLVISEPDAGPYSAMNKGVRAAHGEYVIMMNAGDRFYDQASLGKLVAAARLSGADMVSGQCHMMLADGLYRDLHIRNQGAVMFLGGMPFSHQSVIYRKRLHDSIGLYDYSSNKYACDYDFILKAFHAGHKFYAIEDVVAVFTKDGMSSVGSRYFHESVAIRKKYFDFLASEYYPFIGDPVAYINPQQRDVLLHIWAKYSKSDKLFAKSISEFFYTKYLRMSVDRFNRAYSISDSSIFPEHPGKTAYILGNGPSLRGFDFKQKLKYYPSFGMNLAFRYWEEIEWHPQYYSCLDLVVGIAHKEDIARLITNRKKLGIRRFLLRDNLISELGELGALDCVDNFDILAKDNPEAFPTDLITTGSHTLAWAAWLGYENLILLGMDGSYVNKIPEAKELGGNQLEIARTPVHNPNYFFDSYQRSGDRYMLPEAVPNVQVHVAAWKAVEMALYKRKAQAVNCSLNSKINVFAKRSFDEALPQILLLKFRRFSPKAYASLIEDRLARFDLDELPPYAFQINENEQKLTGAFRSHADLALVDARPGLCEKTLEVYLILDIFGELEVEFYLEELGPERKIVFSRKIKLERWTQRHIHFSIPGVHLERPLAARINYGGARVFLRRIMLAEAGDSIENSYGPIADDFAMANKLYRDGDYLAALGLYMRHMARHPHGKFNANAVLCARKLRLRGIGEGALLPVGNLEQRLQSELASLPTPVSGNAPAPLR